MATPTVTYNSAVRRYKREHYAITFSYTAGSATDGVELEVPVKGTLLRVRMAGTSILPKVVRTGSGALDTVYQAASAAALSDEEANVPYFAEDGKLTIEPGASGAVEVEVFIAEGWV